MRRTFFRFGLLSLLLGLLCGGFSACDEKITPTPEACTEHAYGEWVVTEEPSCTAGGLEARSCANCEAEQTQTVPALGHDTGEWVTTVAASCAGNGILQATCARCEALFSEVTNPLETHDLYEYKRLEPTCIRDGYAQLRCACYIKTELLPLPKLGGHKDGNGDLSCDACAEALTAIPVELICKGNASAEAVQSVLVSEESGGIVEVTMGEHSILYDSITHYPPSASDPSFVGGHGVHQVLSYIYAEEFPSMTGTYQHYVPQKNDVFGSPVKVALTIADTTQTALVVVTPRCEQNENGLLSSQVQLYWGTLVDPNDAEALNDPNNQIVVPARFVRDDEHTRISVLRYTDEEGNVLATEADYTMVATEPITHLNIYYEKYEKSPAA